jgi:hypothetical protein
MRLARCGIFLVGLVWAGFLAAPARSDDNSRAVNIIESPGSAPGTAPSPALAPPPAAIDVHQAAIRTDNAAGVQLTILPDVELTAGTKVVFRIASEASGYLILVDVDPTGKLTQIYPNRHSLQVRDSPESLNFVKAGQTVTIPNQQNPFAGFEFVTAPPAGIAMIIAILSNRPVHMLDLPDVVPPQAGQAAFDQLYEAARRLRIVRDEGAESLQEPKWSFDAKLYLVR